MSAIGWLNTIDITEDLQKEMHAFIEQLMAAKPSITYEAAQTVFLLNKIAELIKEVNNLREQLLPTLS